MRLSRCVDCQMRRLLGPEPSEESDISAVAAAERIDGGIETMMNHAHIAETTVRVCLIGGNRDQLRMRVPCINRCEPGFVGMMERGNHRHIRR